MKKKVFLSVLCVEPGSLFKEEQIIYRTTTEAFEARNLFINRPPAEEKPSKNRWNISNRYGLAICQFVGINSRDAVRWARFLSRKYDFNKPNEELMNDQEARRVFNKFKKYLEGFNISVI